MYSDSQRIDISKVQYREYGLNDEVITEKHKVSIGYVSEIKNKLSGENTYIVTKDINN